MLFKQKESEALRKLISGFLASNYEVVQKEFMFLSPREKIKLYTELMQFGLPHLKSVKTEIDFDQFTDAQLDYIIDELRKTMTEGDEDEQNP